MPSLSSHYSVLERLKISLQEEKCKRHKLKTLYNWEKNARPAQKQPKGNWRIWLILAGRGFGKTRTGAETIRQWVQNNQAKKICLLGHTFNDTHSVMIEGVSGILSTHSDTEGLVYKRSQRMLVWPNGAQATAYSASSYEQLRGPQFDSAWIDELAKFTYAQEAWDQIMLSLRLGSHPRVIITTTPRPIPLLKHLIQRQDTVITRGSTFENAPNLSNSFLKNIKETYTNTRLGLQEIEGQLLDAPKGTLWTSDLLQKTSRSPRDLDRIVVAIDPAVTCTDVSDETGLIVAGSTEQGQAYILDDLSGRLSPAQWAKTAVQAYHDYRADRIVAEVNNGGDLVEKMIRMINPDVAYTAVRATRGKHTRAEPVAALYEQRRIFHTQDFPVLENQMLHYGAPGNRISPDRLDALVWAITALLLDPKGNIQQEIKQRIWSI